MAFIRQLKAREILDSRGTPTIEVDLSTDKGLFRAAVPAGVSTGIHEAVELRDKDLNRYMGKGVLSAVKNINDTIAPKLFGKNVLEQAELDKMMYEELDGSQNEEGWTKEKLGANAILAVSMAICRAAAACKNQTLYQRVAELAGKPTEKYVLPVPAFNVINGGAYAGNGLAIQELMVLPDGANTFREALQIGSEVLHTLKKILEEKYGEDSTNVADEGGFAPNIAESEEALEVLMLAIEKSGYMGKVKIAVGVGASKFYDADSKKYDFHWKNKEKKRKNMLTHEELGLQLKSWLDKYPLVSFEDPFDQDDWDGYRCFTALVGDNVQVAGDDLLVTNPKRITKAQEGEPAVNALLLKLSQIGTVTEAVEACKMSQEKGWGVLVSHRSGETEDVFIADLSVGLRAGQIKTGAPCRSEHNAKYNQLLRIEEELGDRAVYAGKNFRRPQ